MTVPDCESARLSLGALVLGALTPAEREDVERHVARCDRCRAELAELAPLPGLLNLARPDDIPSGDADDVRPSPRLLESLMAAADGGHEGRSGSTPTPRADHGRHRGASRPPGRRERARPAVRPARRRVWLVAVGAAAGAMVVAAVAWLVVALGGSPDDVGPAGLVASATDPVTNVAATVELTPVGDGTDVAVRITGVPSGQECDLVVVTTDGDSGVAKTWTVGDDYTDGPASVTGHVRFTTDAIDRLDVTTTDDRVLLTVPFG